MPSNSRILGSFSFQLRYNAHILIHHPIDFTNCINSHSPPHCKTFHQFRKFPQFLSTGPYLETADFHYPKLALSHLEFTWESSICIYFALTSSTHHHSSSKLMPHNNVSMTECIMTWLWFLYRTYVWRPHIIKVCIFSYDHTTTKSPTDTSARMHPCWVIQCCIFNILCVSVFIPFCVE